MARISLGRGRLFYDDVSQEIEDPCDEIRETRSRIVEFLRTNGARSTWASIEHSVSNDDVVFHLAIYGLEDDGAVTILRELVLLTEGLGIQ